jgi:hypothetical protein
MKKAFHLLQRIKLKDGLIQVGLMRLVDLVPFHGVIVNPLFRHAQRVWHKLVFQCDSDLIR